MTVADSIIRIWHAGFYMAVAAIKVWARVK